MIDLRKAVGSALQTHPEDQIEHRLTAWGEALDPESVLGEYPRPQMRRYSYRNLNGYWDYAIAGAPDMEHERSFGLPKFDITDMPDEFDGKILVPFSPESLLSGVGRQLLPGQTLWYRRTLQVNRNPDMRYLLHFDAVDAFCECFVNGISVGIGTCGYAPLTFDMTDALDPLFGVEQAADIVLAVQDPSEHWVQPRGKQRLDRGSIWYTAQSGIWQTVWMEEVPSIHISHMDVNADPDKAELELDLRLSCWTSQSDVPYSVRMLDGDVEIVHVGGKLEHTEETSELILKFAVLVPNPHLWSPADPFLYGLEISVGIDAVESYCAFRTFTVERIPANGEGARAFCLNHEPLFLKGVLDQGYWPDGLLTAPADEALIFDIDLACSLGFNMIRKHLRVEPARWYYHCDRLGMIVWQDMVNGGGAYSNFYTSQLPTLCPRIAEHVDDTRDLGRFGSQNEDARTLWLECATATVEHLSFFPCIATWTVFNEGWGQFDADAMTDILESMDGTRPFDQASGWFDQGGGSYVSQHNYFRHLAVPKGRTKDDRRARVISEFGGFARHVAEHSSLSRAYGYSICETDAEFRDEVSGCIAKANSLEREGLSGYVYTQLTDVEEEVNGLITYDRKVLKVDGDALGIV